MGGLQYSATGRLRALGPAAGCIRHWHGTDPYHCTDPYKHVLRFTRLQRMAFSPIQDVRNKSAYYDSPGIITRRLLKTKPELVVKVTRWRREPDDLS